MNVSLSVIPEDGGSNFLLKLCRRMLKCAASYPALPDLFSRTPNIFLNDGITKPVTCHVLPSQTANAVVPSKRFVVLFVCKLRSPGTAASRCANLAAYPPPSTFTPLKSSRASSRQHPLQAHATMRGRSGGSINYSLSSGPGDGDNPDESEYVRGASGGNSCVFLSQGREWLQQFNVQ